MKILFICTHNRCRSILFEAITNHYAQGQLEAKSAGSQPVGDVHPLSIKYLREAGVPTHGLRSQSWDEQEHFAPDVVVTVCDSAAGETCPVWFGNSIKCHWGMRDPSKLWDPQHGQEPDEEVADAFRETIALMRGRVDELIDISKQPKEMWPAELASLTAPARI